MGYGKYEMGIVEVFAGCVVASCVLAACAESALIIRLNAAVSSSVLVRIMGFLLYHRFQQQIGSWNVKVPVAILSTRCVH